MVASRHQISGGLTVSLVSDGCQVEPTLMDTSRERLRYCGGVKSDSCEIPFFAIGTLSTLA